MSVFGWEIGGIIYHMTKTILSANLDFPKGFPPVVVTQETMEKIENDSSRKTATDLLEERRALFNQYTHFNLQTLRRERVVWTFMYGQEIEYKLVKLDRVTDVNRLIARFDCDNLMLNYYLGTQALHDTEHTTYLFVSPDDSEMYGYVSFQCSGLSTLTQDEHKWRITSPAIQISYFALETVYQHLLYRPDVAHLYLSDMMIQDVISLLANIATQTVAAKYLIAYSLPTAEKFYRRNGFKAFSEYISTIPSTDKVKKAVADESQFIQECVPMFLEI